MASQHPRILLVDSYDSFTHNLAALCRRSIPNCSVQIIKNDELSIDALRPYLRYFSAVVVGPGPGSPGIPEDIGIVRDLWKLDDEYVLPIFGVCLGLQSLALEFGGTLRRLNVVKHGQISQVHHHVGSEIFLGVEDIHAVRYHSLHVTIPEDGPIKELAWVDEEDNGRVVMAAKHSNRPFWAVQYHPESVRTEGGGWKVLSNFWALVQEWSTRTGRVPIPWDPAVAGQVGSAWPYNNTLRIKPPSATSSPVSIHTCSLNLPQLSLPIICEHLGVLEERSKFVALDSASHPGRFSIIGSLLPNSLQVTYYVGDPFVSLSQGSQTISEPLGAQDAWKWLATYLRSKKVPKGDPSIPFWGGFIGYFSYEMGLPTVHVPLLHRKEKRHPDVNLAFVERSIVLDHGTGTIHIQSLLPSDKAWVEQVAQDLTDLSRSPPSSGRRSNMLSPVSTLTLPEKDSYIYKIKQAKEYLYSGDSYELCLTAQTKISIPHHETKDSTTSTSWERYLQLREKNPAPHSAYLRLHPTTLMSSSPERFLSYSRPPNSVCQLRPIKGTIRKGPGITREVAEKALVGSPKEVAENLMIVDLIRHDLHGVVGENVAVSKFCGVEEYETVWQLVSVIEGKEDPSSSVDEELGWNVLKASLPPGSMTGAPKKRSVEILQHLEDSEREVYSGVFGYWDIAGGGDWSVTIRSCFKYDDLSAKPSDCSGSNEEWALGAGGAITALSDPEAEWDEMVVKLQSVLKSFGVAPPNSY